jgi:DNA-binding CsgD family transcriptional regulator
MTSEFAIRSDESRPMFESVSLARFASAGASADAPNAWPKSGLLGRRRECDALDRLLERVREEQSQVLVLRGEPGVGKTALLEYLVRKASASGSRIARASGIESEMELAFSGLHQLCGPMLDRLGHLPAPQRDALSTAFGLCAGAPADHFLVSLAALSLMAEVAEEQPLVCVVDDAQWLDRASIQVFAFVARRLLAESIAFVFAVREPGVGLKLEGLPVLMVGGLSAADARALLDSVVPGRLDEQVRDRIVAETSGNPLALLELPRGLTAAELAGGFGRLDARPLACLIEESFLRRLQSLPVATQRLILTAAAEPLGDVTLLRRAAERLGIQGDAATQAEAAGLIEFGARVRFPHPLVRSAAYRTVSLAERQEVHRALAEATDPASNPDRRAWHRAQAATGFDEEVADELELSADRARCRGGVAAAAAFLERATELTPDPARRGARALAAAQAKFEAAAPDTADELLSIAELGPLDDLQRARAARLRAQIAFVRSRGSDAPPLLLEAAKAFDGLDDGLARETYLEAFGAAMFAGRLGGRHGLREVAEAARTAPPGPQPARPSDLLLDGMATLHLERLTQEGWISEGSRAGVPTLQRALEALRQEDPRTKDQIMGLLRLSPMAQSMAFHELWEYEGWHELSTRSVQLAREAGAVAVLPMLLAYLAGAHVYAGEFVAAAALIEESDSITTATGNAPMRYAAVFLAGWRGDEAPALKLIETAVKDATARGEGRIFGLTGHVVAVLYNGLGRYPAALAGARQSCEHGDLGYAAGSLAELVEAGARSGAVGEAAVALRQLEERTRASGTDWALGVLARSKALLTDGQAAESLYREAIERLERSRVVIHLARAHLVYGEWLRRENRRLDGREHLRIAHQTFSDVGAEAFAERARGELLATGETVRKRTVETRDVLTAQESQIVRLAAERQTNTEIASQLFISPRTVEYHLHKVFTKLGVSSRRELPTALRELEGAMSLS